jgi:serine protease Do
MKGKWRVTLTAGTVAAGLALVPGLALRAQNPDPPAPAPAAQNFVYLNQNTAWLGILLKDVNEASARDLKLPGVYGAVVTGVEKDSPAAKAGLAQNDVILKFAGERVWSVAEMRRMVRETPVDRTVALEVSRDGHRRTVEVTPTANTSRFEIPAYMPRIRMPQFFDFHVSMGDSRLGISGDSLTPQLARFFGVKQGKGVLVREVEPGGAAEKAGLKAGDCIVRVGKQAVGSVGELRKALEAAGADKNPVSLGIVRKGQEQELAVKLVPPGDTLSGSQAPEVEQELQREFDQHKQDLQQLQQQLQGVQGQMLTDQLMQQSDMLKGATQQQMESLTRDLGRLRRDEQLQIQQLQLQMQRMPSLQPGSSYPPFL